MNHEQESNAIATYALIQEAINNTSNLVIQVFGFSLAAIVTIILASIATKSSEIVSSVVLLFFAVLIILLSSIYINIQTKLLIEIEAYIAIFIEPKLSQELQWRKVINKKSTKDMRSNKEYTFSSTLISTLKFLNFLPFAYAVILGFIAWLVNNDIYNRAEKLNSKNKLIVAAVIIAIGIILFSFWEKKEYRPEIYYQKCKQDFEKQKQQEESFKPSQAKLVDSNGK